MITDEGSEKTESVLGLRCPTCHALLSVRSGQAPPGYSCVAGHAFTPASLLASDDGTLRKAIEQALRVWEERAGILRDMAARGAASGPEDLTCCFDREAGGLEARIAVLRETLAGRPAA